MDQECSDQSKVKGHKECSERDGARSRLLDDSRVGVRPTPPEISDLAKWFSKPAPADKPGLLPTDKPAPAPAPAKADKPPPAAETPKPALVQPSPGRPAKAGEYDVRALTLENHAWTEPKSHQPGAPDAIVAMPRDFDPRKPINLVIYNHGFLDSAASAVNSAHLAEQMKNAAPNTVLIVPEWQERPGSKSYDEGRFATANVFNNMVQECFSKTPELAGKTLDNVANVSVIAHSGGHYPTEAEIYNNAGPYRTKDGQLHQGISNKVNRLNLLDAMYSATAFDPWLRENLNDLAAGKKQFGNVYAKTTRNSEAQEQRVLNMLSEKHLSRSLVHSDVRNPGSVMTPAEMKHSIFFKRSDARAGNLGPHASLPYLYIGPIESQ